MGPTTEPAFADRLRGLDEGAFAAFIAALWAARGYDVERDDRRLRVADGEPETTVATVAAGESPSGISADVVVTAETDLTEEMPPDARRIGPAELHELTTYGVGREHRRRLLAEHLGLTQGEGEEPSGAAGPEESPPEEADTGADGDADDAHADGDADDGDGSRDGGGRTAVAGDQSAGGQTDPDHGRTETDGLLAAATAVTPSGPDGGVARSSETAAGPGTADAGSGSRDRGTDADAGRGPSGWSPYGADGPDGDGGSPDSEDRSSGGPRGSVVAVAVLVLGGLVAGGVLAADGPGGLLDDGDPGVPGADGGNLTTPTPAQTTPEPTPTPTAEPTRSPAPDGSGAEAETAATLQNLSPEAYPSGVGPDGVEEPRALGADHERSTRGESYRVVLVYREYTGTKELGYRREVVTVAEPTVYRSEVEVAGEFVGVSAGFREIQTYADGNTVYRREDGPDGAQYDRNALFGTSGDQATRIGRYVAWFAAVNRTVVADTFRRDGRRYFWIRLSSGRFDPSGDVTGSLLVDDRGIVHEVRRRARLEDRPAVTTEFVVRYEQFGNVTVQPPPWYDEARNRTGPNGTEAG